MARNAAYQAHPRRAVAARAIHADDSLAVVAPTAAALERQEG
jgi:hypothetical protein